MKVVVERIEKETIFIKTMEGKVYGIPIVFFHNPSIGDIYRIEKSMENEGNELLFVFDEDPRY